MMTQTASSLSSHAPKKSKFTARSVGLPSLTQKYSYSEKLHRSEKKMKSWLSLRVAYQFDWLIDWLFICSNML